MYKDIMCVMLYCRVNVVPSLKVSVSMRSVLFKPETASSAAAPVVRVVRTAGPHFGSACGTQFVATRAQKAVAVRGQKSHLGTRVMRS